MPNKPTGRSIYPYYYKGGEIYSCDFSGLKDNSKELFKRLGEEKAFILSANGHMRIWLNLCDTKLTTSVKKELLCWTESLQLNIYKLALVGLPKETFWGVKLPGALSISNPHFPTCRFTDPEEAKTWLVSEP